MGRMVIEVPEELTELGKAMAEQLAEVQRTMARQGGGKAVDYALVEQAVCEAAGRTEREAHRAILQSLDIDVPAVVIGKVVAGKATRRVWFSYWTRSFKPRGQPSATGEVSTRLRVPSVT